MRRLSPDEYAGIKQLLNMGYNANRVARTVGRSWCVVNTVKKSMSYAEYIKQRRAQVRRAEENRKARQLQLDTPKKTEYSLIQGMTDRITALRDDIELYRATPACSGRERQRDAAYALVKLEEAAMWLTCHW